MTLLNIALLQAPFIIGNPLKNAQIIDEMIQEAIASHADLIITPECALSGYLPEDVLFRKEHQEQVQIALQSLLEKNYTATVVIGLPILEDGKLFNAAYVIQNKKIIATYCKRSLPNYAEFDEKRYFSPGNFSTVFLCKGASIGLFICEDLWDPAIVDSIPADSIDCLISLNASPYHVGKYDERISLLTQLAKSKKTSIAYVNCVGGQDALLFDGCSTFINEQGSICVLAKAFKKQILQAQLNIPKKTLSESSQIMARSQDSTETLITGLALGIHDYVRKNHFSRGVLVALSGGIDSAVTLALAVHALGADQVEAVYMPSHYNAKISEEDAQEQAKALKVSFKVIPIEPIIQTISRSLAPLFLNEPSDITEENIQARARGLLIMALSNKFKKLVLTTGNKSEYAVGYATLYGDMCGGFAPIKDIYKTQVYAIAHKLNEMGLYIPKRVITREPSAELSENQLDSQSLPPYHLLDQILELFIEEDLCDEAIHKITEIDPVTIRRITQLVVKNEYKRQQSAVGPKVSKRDLGKDRRYPLTLDSKIFSENFQN